MKGKKKISSQSAWQRFILTASVNNVGSHPRTISGGAPGVKTCGVGAVVNNKNKYSRNFTGGQYTHKK